MRTRLHGLTLATVASLAALGSASLMPSSAEAHGKFRYRPGFAVVIGDGYGYGYGYRPYLRTGCGWLFDRWEDTGNPKWYNRWHRCKYGW